MVRLPEVYRAQLQKWQEQHEKKHRVRPTVTDGVRLAVEDFLSQHGLWPLPDEPNEQ